MNKPNQGQGKGPGSYWNEWNQGFIGSSEYDHDWWSWNQWSENPEESEEAQDGDINALGKGKAKGKGNKGKGKGFKGDCWTCGKRGTDNISVGGTSKAKETKVKEKERMEKELDG